jgi:fatty acid-binding protein DegV
MSQPDQHIAIVVDADACVPERIRRDLDIVTAPPDAPLFAGNVSLSQLRLDQAPAPADEAAEACLRAAEHASTVLYVAAGDRYGGCDAAVERAAVLLRQRAPGVTFASHATEGALMACGWQAIAAAVAIRQGSTVDAALEAASEVRDRVQVLVALDHPELVGAADTLSLALRRRRAIARLSGDEVQVLERTSRRDELLVNLRDRFGESVREGESEGRLRVAIHHAGAEGAAQAMARWAQQTVTPEEVVIAPLTHHATTRLGPAMVGFAWYRDPSS